MKLMNERDEKEFARIIELMRADESADAPPDAIRWSKNIFRARVVEPKISFPQRILASLQMNLSPDRAAFGERSAANSQARQMLFQAGETVLDLRITKTGKNFSLRGQILGENFAGGVVRLGDFETTANENGEFVFNDIPGGKYDLTARIEGQEIVVEDLPLQ